MPTFRSSSPNKSPAGPAPTMTTWVRVVLEVILEVQEPLAWSGVRHLRITAAGAQRRVARHRVGFISGIVHARNQAPLRVIAAELQGDVHGGHVVVLRDLRGVGGVEEGLGLIAH